LLAVAIWGGVGLPRSRAPEQPLKPRHRAYLLVGRGRQWLAIRRYPDGEITLGRAAEVAGVTRWRFQELLALRGLRVTLEARPAKELDEAVERIRRRRQ
jgi:predicted HTH domain antitoxin